MNIEEISARKRKGFSSDRKSGLNAIARFSNYEENKTPFLLHKPITLFSITNFDVHL